VKTIIGSEIDVPSPGPIGKTGPLKIYVFTTPKLDKGDTPPSTAFIDSP
jgi:hypothetical protein